MLPKLLTSIFGSRNERLLKGYRRTVQQINALVGSGGARSDFSRMIEVLERASGVKAPEHTGAAKPQL